MSQYRDMVVPDQLDNVIKYMKDVDSYREELTILGQGWDLLTILGQMSGGRTDMSTTREGFRDLTEHLIGSLGVETLAKTTQEISAKAQVSVDIIIRNLFERTADIGFLATDGDIREFIQNTKSIEPSIDGISAESLPSNLKNIVERFQEYVDKYSVYNNIILLDTEGKVLAQLDDNNSITSSSDPLIQESLNTQEEYVETYRHSDLVSDEKKSLIYSYRVTETNDKSSKSLGVLCLCFRFENEMKGIFDNLTSEEDWSVLTLLDKEGTVIASHNPYQIPVGAKMEIALEQDFKIVKFAGLRYIAKTVATKGYQGFNGLNWYGHVMLPLDVAFEASNINSIKKLDQEILQSVLHNPQLFSDDIQSIPAEAEKIQNDLDRTVWNGNILPEDSNSDASSSASKVLLWEVSKTGMKTKNVFERAIKNLHETVVTTYLNDVEFLASLSIDIMDRNLYERANDCRWWALTSEFRRILSKEKIDETDLQTIQDILSYINDLYTVYTNLFIYDKRGKVIATSSSSERHLVGETISERWITETLNIKDSQIYSVSPFEKTHLYGDRHTYTYNASITDINHSSSIVGGICVVFDSEPEFEVMLLDSLPREKDKLVEGCFGVFTDKSGLIISSTKDDLVVGNHLEVDPDLFGAGSENGLSKICVFNDHYYAVGTRSSRGYREYKSQQDSYNNEVFSFIFRQLDKVRSEEEMSLGKQKVKMNSDENQRIPRGEYHEVATFYIDDRWYGIKAEQVIEAIELTELSSIPGSPDSVMGTMFYKQEPLLVLNPRELLNSPETEDSTNVQIIVMDTSHGPVGIAIDSLGEIPKYDKHRLDRDSGIISESNKFIAALVKPEVNEDQSTMLIVLDPDGLVTQITGAELEPEEA